MFISFIHNLLYKDEYLNESQIVTPVPNQESERSRVWVCDIDFASFLLLFYLVLELFLQCGIYFHLSNFSLAFILLLKCFCITLLTEYQPITFVSGEHSS